MIPLKRIISGGQTGADRGGLDAAIEGGIEHGGWCPRGRRAEDGVIPNRYVLQETPSDRYEDRTYRNVRDSEATIIFTVGPITRGSRLTLRACLDLHKQVHHVDLGSMDEHQAVRTVAEWLDSCSRFGTRVYTLNIAGSRESKAPGIEAKVKTVMLKVLGARERTGTKQDNAEDFFS